MCLKSSASVHRDLSWEVKPFMIFSSSIILRRVSAERYSHVEQVYLESLLCEIVLSSSNPPSQPPGLGGVLGVDLDWHSWEWTLGHQVNSSGTLLSLASRVAVWLDWQIWGWMSKWTLGTLRRWYWTSSSSMVWIDRLEGGWTIFHNFVFL